MTLKLIHDSREPDGFSASTEKHDVDLRPILVAIARAWNTIHPGDLTPIQALGLLGVLTDIAESTQKGKHQ